MVYLDNNASTKMDPEVRAAVDEAAGWFGNPSSVHAEGRKARRAIEEARGDVASLLGAQADEVFFTSGGTEANALAIFGSVRGRRGRIIRTAVEHPSVWEPFDRLSREGHEVISVPPEPSGGLDPDRFLEEVVPGTVLVSIMAANNEYGGLLPVSGVTREARSRGARVHTDAVQAVGRIPVDVREWEVDLLSCSAHKLHGPKGVGALYVRRGLPLEAHTPGGGQEKRLRAGTENTPGIVGFGVAARLARERRENDAATVSKLRDRFEAGLRARVSGAEVIGSAAPRLPNTSAVLFEGVSGEALLVRLDLEGVAVSVGSACSSGTLSPSPALLALGLSRARARSVVRFSLSRFTTPGEIDLVLDLLERLVPNARRASPVPAAAAT